MAKKKINNQKTAARMVLDVLKKHEALDAETAIDIEYFKNLKLTSAVIAYTIGNLINDNVVVKTGDDRYYFNEDGWKKLEKKVNRGYVILLGLPVIALAFVMLIKYIFGI